MAVKYAKTSPWHLTNFSSGNYLDIMKKRRVTAQADDILWEITPQYTYRPDLLAFDLYSTSKLWWVFAARNIDIIRDPVFDFVPGTKIYLPKKSSLDNLLG
jgi:hypothetical protein